MSAATWNEPGFKYETLHAKYARLHDLYGHFLTKKERDNVERCFEGAYAEVGSVLVPSDTARQGV